MTLFKTTLWTGFSTFIKIISTYVMWKIIAIYTGPSGMAIIEQFQNFIQICRSFSCSLNQGIIKYVAEYKTDNESKIRILSTAFSFYFIVSCIAAAFLLLFCNQISGRVFHSFTYKPIIMTLSFSIILFSLNNLLLSTLNGELEIKKFVTCNIANTLLIFILSVCLVIKFGIQGALIGHVLNQSIILFFTIFLIIKSNWFRLSNYFQGIDKKSLYKLLSYATISFVPILIVPLSLVVSRKLIASELSWQDAGYWQGVMKLSDGYLILMELMVSIYFLPKISATKKLAEFKSEMFNCSRLIIPFAFVGAFFIFLLKKQIVILLYSDEFLPMVILFKFQLIGDIARIGTWLLANVMAAKAMIKTLVISEIIFNTSFIIFTYVFVHYLGLIGTSVGFAVNSVIYLLVLIFLTSKFLRDGSFRLEI